MEVESVEKPKIYDSDFAWQTEPWPEGEYIVSEKDRNAEKFLFAIAKTK